MKPNSTQMCRVLITLVLIILCLSSRTAYAARDVRCGAYCLYVALVGLDVAVPPFEEFSKSLGAPNAEGYSLAQLADAATQHKVHSLGVATNPTNLSRRREKFACIALMKPGHFVLITGVDGGTAKIIDPPGQSSVPLDTLKAMWPGNALLVSKEPLAAEETLKESRFLTWLAIGCAVAAGISLVYWWRKRGT